MRNSMTGSAANTPTKWAVPHISVLRAKLPNLPEFAELDAYDAKVLNQSDKVEATLRLIGPAPSGWLDRVLNVSVAPITLTLEMPEIPESRMRGELVRLRSAAARS